MKTTTEQESRMRPCEKQRPVSILWALILLLIVLHQDVWFWDDKRLLLGFLPIGLFYHMGLSVAAAATWLLATRIAWPADDSASGNERSNGADS